MKPLLCHLQIAKAASNTLRALMQTNFPPPRLELLKIVERSHAGQPVTLRSGHAAVRSGLERIAARQHELAAVSMMAAFGLHDHLSRPVRYFSFVREPVARALSALHFVHARRDTHPAAAYFESHRYRPSALIADGELMFCNDQVRILSGTDHAEVDASDLARAKRNIERHFDFVGNSAALAACWPRLCQLTGLRGDASVVLNRGRYTDELRLDGTELAALKRANAYDAELVAWIDHDYLPRVHGLSPAAVHA